MAQYHKLKTRDQSNDRMIVVFTPKKDENTIGFWLLSVRKIPEKNRSAEKIVKICVTPDEILHLVMLYHSKFNPVSMICHSIYSPVL